MTLAELSDYVTEMESAAGKYNADPSKVRVQVYAHGGELKSVTLLGILKSLTIHLEPAKD